MKISDRKLIEETIDGIKKIKDVKAIVLFGSFAKGTEKPISDIDICVITKKNIPGKVKSEIGSYASRKIEISLFWDLPLVVRYAALREGKILFNKDKEFMHDATVRTMSEYLDFKHIIDRNIERVFGK